MTHNLLGKAALFTGTVALAAIVTTGPAMAQPGPQPGDGSSDVRISSQNAHVRSDLADIASNLAALPAPAPPRRSAGTGGDLDLLGGGAAGLLLAAAVGVTLTRRHRAAAPRTA